MLMLHVVILRNLVPYINTLLSFSFFLFMHCSHNKFKSTSVLVFDIIPSSHLGNDFNPHHASSNLAIAIAYENNITPHYDRSSLRPSFIQSFKIIHHLFLKQNRNIHTCDCSRIWGSCWRSPEAVMLNPLTMYS